MTARSRVAARTTLTIQLLSECPPLVASSSALYFTDSGSRTVIRATAPASTSSSTSDSSAPAEEVGAAVVLKPGQDVSTDELRSYVKEEVANYKYPRKIWFPDELPKGPTGKILKREIEPPEDA